MYTWYMDAPLRLNMGEDANESGHFYPRYSTPLHDATTCGRVQICKVLIERYKYFLKIRKFCSLA